MPKFRVNYYRHQYVTVVVEASDEDEAIMDGYDAIDEILAHDGCWEYDGDVEEIDE